MTREEIIEMAKQAGFERLGVYAQFGDDWVGFTKDLETFAKLIAEKEREECAKICDQYALEDHENWAGGCAFAIRKRGQE